MTSAFDKLRLLLAPPARVAVDLRRLDAEGGSGGVKPLLLHQLSAAMRLLPKWHWRVLANPETRAELSARFVGARCDVQVACDSWLHDPMPRVDLPETDLLFHPFPHWDEPASDTPALVSLVVDTLHRDLPEALDQGSRERRERMLSALLPKSRAVVVISEFVRRQVQLQFGVAASRIHTCPPVLPDKTDAHESEASLPPGLTPQNYLYYPANFWPHKHHTFLLDVRRSAGGTLPKIVCAGEPSAEREALARTWAEAGFSESLIVLPHQPERMHRLLIRQAKALLFPSRYEGWGMPVVEALRARVPVVRSRCPALNESSLGFGLTPGESPAAWAAALQRPMPTPASPAAFKTWKRWEEPLGLTRALLSARSR